MGGRTHEPLAAVGRYLIGNPGGPMAADSDSHDAVGSGAGDHDDRSGVDAALGAEPELEAPADDGLWMLGV